MLEYRVLPAGDTALVVEFGDRIDRRLSACVLALAHRLDDAQLAGVIETVPTFRSLMVHYEPLVLPAATLTAQIAALMQGLRPATKGGRLWRLPACYDASLAPDLADVTACTSLSPAQIVERHSGVTYHVYMLGFLPGQAYMGDLPEELVLARRETPRSKIPAGSLAIAMGMTSIFPMETPCGWNLIGRSPVALWRGEAGALLAPGDQVTFAPVSLREYEDLAAKAADSRLGVEPVDHVMGAAA
jgi:inhibitor of KinA